MDTAVFDALLRPEGQAALAAAADLDPTEETFLPALTRLQKSVEPALAKAALETVILRRKAAAKFSQAGMMYFTRDGLEMASGEAVAGYRAGRYRTFATVADLCCGLGGDTLSLAVAGRVTAVDRGRLNLLMARANLAACGLEAGFVEGDVSQSLPPRAEALFFDPGRRSGGRRVFSVDNYEPPLAVIRTWGSRPLGVKISPGVRLNELEAYDCEREFISLDGDLKECVLWFGGLRTATRRATILSASGQVYSQAAPESEPPVRLSPPLAFLYEPDPSILRTGLVTTLAGQLGAAQLDAEIAFLTAETLRPTPFARAFALEAGLPFSLKRLKATLRERGIGRVTVKKRGSPLDANALARALRLSDDPAAEERVVFLTQVRDKPWVLIGRPLLA